ncbi:hypothetical protein BAU18_001857 [Enterococcus diestrammenae]|uniref:Uncharacterized protein n=1 Tax=Enterococcus diestrammenae TaxID=1155073 RepID=A0ABV0F2I5_9ENTE
MKYYKITFSVNCKTEELTASFSATSPDEAIGKLHWHYHGNYIKVLRIN